MKYLTIALIILTSQCFAQDIKTVSRDSTDRYEQTFQVLKSNSKVKQGAYKLILVKPGKVFTTGFYKDNLKDSVWNEYDYAGGLLASGKYKVGKKHGEWTYYDGKSAVVNKYDFTKNELTYHKPTALDDTHRFLIINGTDSVISKLDRAPFYLGGEALMSRTTVYDHQSPLAALKKQLVVTVVVKFMVDENGKTSNFAVEKPVGYGCDEEALRLIKILPEKWLPGQINGKNVTAIMRVPLSFNYTVANTIIVPTQVTNR